MPKDKYLTKNEFRLDLNRNHFGKDMRPHPAYITARKRHMYRANSITHARRTTDGFETLVINENPNKLSKDKRPTRVSRPYWQNTSQFSDNTLTGFRYSNKSRKEIHKFNKKFK